MGRRSGIVLTMAALALVIAFALLGGRLGNGGPSTDEVIERLDEMRAQLRAMEAQSARIKLEHDTLKVVLSQLQQEQREELIARLQSELTSARLQADSFPAQMDAIANDPLLTSEEKNARMVALLTPSLTEFDEAIERQERLIRERPSSVASIDVETMKLKRLIDKRAHAFDLLRDIIDRYNQTAKGIIDGIGR
jgi:hypothetical protein